MVTSANFFFEKKNNVLLSSYGWSNIHYVAQIGPELSNLAASL